MTPDEIDELTREASSYDTETLKAKLKLFRENSLKLYRRFIDEKPELFARFVCEATLGIADLEDRNVFNKRMDDGSVVPYERLQRRNSDLANAILKKLNDDCPIHSEAEYICIKEWVADRLNVRNLYHEHVIDPSPEVILEQFFRVNREQLGLCLLFASDLVYNGIPLFEKNGDDNSFVQLPYSHEDYIYLSQKGKRQEEYDTGMFPDWAIKYFMKREHLDAHKIFFSWSGERPDENANSALRTALRRHIGCEELPNDHSPNYLSNGKHKTKLLDAVYKVISRYYGKGFDINDSDTWAKQVTVVEWLQSELGLSGNEAKAVDIVSRPDVIRGK